MDPSVIKQSGGNISEPREYRKGNWTLQETMVLLEAKKMDDERRMRRLGDAGERGKPPELRWKWVEDYCWNKGCFRSQNQCNDKWDNLMRDFKKVREYEGRLVAAARGGGGGDGGGGEMKSYWRMEKNERKEKNLPTNMVPQIYEALAEAVEKKSQPAVAGTSYGGANVPEKYTGALGQQSMPHHTLQHQPTVQSPAMVLPFPPPLQTAAEPASLPFSRPLPTVDSDTSEYSGSPAKRRKRRGGGEGTSGAAGGTTSEEVGSAISRSASMIAETIQSCDERGERRHREMVNLHERRLQIEASKAEINRQGISGLVDAINNLSSSIRALAANNQPPSS